MKINEEKYKWRRVLPKKIFLFLINSVPDPDSPGSVIFLFHGSESKNINYGSGFSPFFTSGLAIKDVFKSEQIHFNHTDNT